MDGQNSTVYSQGAGGYGYGMGGFPIFGLFGALGLNGLGRDGLASEAGLSQRITDLQIAGVNQNINSAEANLSQGILTQTNNLGQLILEQGNNGVNASRTVGEVLGTQIGGVKDAVQNSQFQTALQTKEILESTNAGTQAILDKLCSQENQALRDQLNTLTLEKELSERGLLTATGPNMAVVANDYRRVDNDVHTQEQINILIQNGLANIANQMPSIVDASVSRALATK